MGLIILPNWTRLRTKRLKKGKKESNDLIDVTVLLSTMYDAKPSSVMGVTAS